ncbi:hypothetical protein SAMN05192560_1952 [Methylobacillus rhizosphaerae]|uniref:Sporulation related domain-containing protein n=1 Tax=Methylobacillus rhizosphaerae TaxID=551994 RepID=A0A239AJK7_9PROT|nr:SPOR domain-containing protein [Methylobacillus rhizosphaerae]SNR95857.1 hypothetical protein SAMN05192560_1952 [Methylobacillus rhizosphaerae]
MKWLLGILLLLNMGLWVGFHNHHVETMPQHGLHAPLSPEKIKLLTSEEIEALPAGSETTGMPGSDKAYACYEWGSFDANSVKRAQAILARNSLMATMQQKTMQETLQYWVYIPPLPSRQAAQDKIRELKAQGVDVSVIMQDAPWRNAISLGVFKDERLATKLLEQLQDRGVALVQKAIRNQEKGRVSLRINDMSAEMVVELNKQGEHFPGSELKQVNCQ